MLWVLLTGLCKEHNYRVKYHRCEFKGYEFYILDLSLNKIDMSMVFLIRFIKVNILSSGTLFVF